MIKKREFFSKENMSFLMQLIKALEEAQLKLEEAYDKKDYDNFNNLKKFILKIQKIISEIVK